MNKKAKLPLKIFVIRLGLVLICVLLCMLLLIRDAVYHRQFYTTNISDYGKYVGNYDNDFPEEFINSFFPEKIEENFSNVKYSYKAQKGDSYAFEAYLEFKIENESEFQAFIDEHVGKNVSDFSYDTNFKEYVIADELGLVVLDQKTSKVDVFYHIQCAKIGKILYSENKKLLKLLADDGAS